MRKKLSRKQKRSIPIYVLLRPRELQVVDMIRREARRAGKNKSRAAVLRDAFLWRYKQLCGAEGEK